MRLPPTFSARPSQSLSARLHREHHRVSRRAFLRAAAGTAAAAYGSQMLGSFPAVAAPPRAGTPQPIPGGAPELGGVFHVFLPGPGNEPSTITDFRGSVGLAVLRGGWTGPGATAESTYESDMRFMRGQYIGTDGQPHPANFGFI